MSMNRGGLDRTQPEGELPSTMQSRYRTHTRGFTRPTRRKLMGSADRGVTHLQYRTAPTF